MTTNYDSIAEQYQRAKLQPWRTHIECFTLLELIGDLAGKRVLDVACGEGYYTRLLRQRGAVAVVGVDLSERMIDLARTRESAQQLGIEYRVGDARDLAPTADFDLIVAAYLLNYARNREELGAMCRSIAGCLRPGGRFVTVNCSPDLDFRTAPSYRQYGFETSIAGEWGEGAPITWTFFLADGPFAIENYHLDRAIHNEAFCAAGFRQITWHRPRLALEGETKPGRDLWATFLAWPPIAFIECVK